ncbi:protein ACCELERATED CELL DEATH 6-like [Quercus lobata]|uniref:PGG domain-containing protein n=1 Tax=Quercus lobata TaxID=97700 RepID=A0A7N2MBF4_QUELO|nr:protein ACCELERATED CELL DEATH 6-like [Quercus lobata]
MADILDLILKKKPDWIHLRDEEGRTPLHWAASIGYLEGVRLLLGRNASIATERDKNGLFPIHIASAKGHVHLIQELLQYWPNSRELLNHNGQNILHVAATTGELNVVNYILKTPGLESLINDTDKDGNTPLHLATMHWHPKLVSAFTWDKKVDLTLINSEGLTALDIAECSMGNTLTFRQRLTMIPLRAAGVPRNPSANARRQCSIILEEQKTDICKDKVNTLLLVSTVVATVTFAAGFSIPGGYNSSGEDSGTATLITHNLFHVFIFCDTIAMYSSVVVAVTLIWAQLGDVHLVLIALKTASPLLGVALATMSLAFLAAVYLVVSTLNWLANVIMIMGLVFLVALIALYFFLWFPMSSSCLILRYVSYYPFCLLVLVAGSGELVV